MGKLLNTGRDFFAQRHLDETDAVITTFIFANVPDLDIETDVSANEIVPVDHVVWSGPITKEGYISNNKIVYSVQLDSTIGNFSFNWMGLQTDDGRLIAVAYVPLQPKIKTSQTTRGNNLARNMMISYVDAKNIVNITIPAETWQYDNSDQFKNLQLQILKIGSATSSALVTNMQQEKRLVNIEVNKWNK